MPKFQSVTGMRDLFGQDLKLFQKIEKASQEIADFYDFKKIETPILEQTGLFEKGTGQTTDIVAKQMFSLRTSGGDQLTLRPEFTPSIIRAYLEQGMESLGKPVNLWSIGPLFRHERPQAGRFRQFYQVNFESIGSLSWIIDAQIIEIFYNILKNIGLTDLSIEVNSIGDSQCRPYYKKMLLSYLRSRRAGFCAECKRRIRDNPLRILDCKNEKCREIVGKGAPQLLDSLCKECHEHFKNMLEALEELGLPFNLNPYLVRGLDYYTKTVFEITCQTEQGDIQGSLAGGGRYDDLVKLLGGKETPACGCALGIDRTVNLLKQKIKRSAKEPAPNVYLAQVGGLAKRKSLVLLEEFRKNKIKISQGLHKDSLSLQLKIADKLKAKHVLILGQKEALEDKIMLRDMKTGRQRILDLKKVVREIKKKK